MKLRSAVKWFALFICLTIAPLVPSGQVIEASNLHTDCQCTAWVRQKRPDLPGGYGSAKDWAERTKADGFSVGSIPAVGAVAVFQPNEQHADAIHGHVAYVEEVYSSTSFRVSEMNVIRDDPCKVNYRTAHTGTDVRFIYNSRNGWAGEYYNNQGLSGTPAFVRTDTSINFDWGGGSPGNGVGADHFSVRWTGRFAFQDSEYTFIAKTDDGMRMWVDNRLIISTWQDQPPSEHHHTRRMSAGNHDVKVEYYENGGGAVAKVEWKPSGDDPVTCSHYRAEYFNNRHLQGIPTFVRCEGWPIDHNWGSGCPGRGVGNDNFSVRWTGRAHIPTGRYTFIVRADDGIRLWLDDNLIIDKWRDQGVTEYKASQQINGGYHTIKMEYYENGGQAVAYLRWVKQEEGNNCDGGEGVYLYEHDAYGGRCQKFTGNSSNPGSWSMGNDSASSIRIIGSWTAEVCEHENYQGACSTFCSSDSALNNNSIGNDRTSSIRAQRGNHCGSSNEGVWLCEHGNYGGRCQKFTSDSPNPRSWSIGNDSASSIRIVGSWTASVCENDNYQGTCSVFSRSDSDFGSDAIGHDRASSIQVQRAGEGGANYYQVAALHSGKCLDVHSASADRGAPLIQWDCHTGANQKWQLVRKGSYYKIIASHSGKCMDVHSASQENGAPIIQWDCHDDDNQLWSTVREGNEYSFVAKHSGKCLDIHSASRDSGAPMIQWDCHGGGNQRFSVTRW